MNVPGRLSHNGRCQEQRTISAALPESPPAEGVRSLEVRWIFPGQLATAVAAWFGRFPAETESREDTYLLNPDLRGLSVKVRAYGALEVKAYHGCVSSTGQRNTSMTPAAPAAAWNPGRDGRFLSTCTDRKTGIHLAGGR
jgi:hypothetical protein